MWRCKQNLIGRFLRHRTQAFLTVIKNYPKSLCNLLAYISAWGTSYAPPSLTDY